MKIYRITPLDSYGEVIGEDRYTDRLDKALEAYLQGHSVMQTEVVSWTTVIPQFVEGK